jgi:hypothetical protein
MTDSFELRLLVSEISISLKAALVTAEQIASHGIVASNDFERLMTLLEDAVSAAERVTQIMNSEGGTATAFDLHAGGLRATSGPSRTAHPNPNTPPLRLIHSRDG